MADVLTFRAETMQEALDKVREKLGPDAVIFHTRQITPKKILPWAKRRSEVEITAGLDINVRPQNAKPFRKSASRPTKQANTSRRSRNSSSAGASSSAMSPAAMLAARTETDAVTTEFTTTSVDERTTSLAQEMRNQGTNNRLQPRPRHTPNQNNNRQQAHQIAERLPGVSAQQLEQPPERHRVKNQPSQSDEVVTRLDAIQKLLEKMGQTQQPLQQPPQQPGIPSELSSIYSELIDLEIEEELAQQLVLHLRDKIRPDQLADKETTLSLIRAMIESEIRCCPPITATNGQQKVVALVGTTGVGKTTTIAKLAANLRLRGNIKMGLVTVDTYRIAAVEQLRTYADIIDLPMKVVTNPLEMRRALDEFSGLDLVLIDTAGRSPRDELQIQELRTLLAEARVDEVHLVLSMTASLKSLESTVRLFSSANPTAVVLTKLDEASSMGAILSLARHSRLPISYLTAGQMVPDDLEVADSGRLSRLIMGQEAIPT